MYSEKAYNIVCVRCQTAVSSKTCSQPPSALSQSAFPARLNCFTAWYTVMLYGNTWLPINSSKWCLVTPCDIDTAACKCNKMTVSLRSSAQLHILYSHVTLHIWMMRYFLILVKNKIDGHCTHTHTCKIWNSGLLHPITSMYQSLSYA